MSILAQPCENSFHLGKAPPLCDEHGFSLGKLCNSARPLRIHRLYMHHEIGALAARKYHEALHRLPLRILPNVQGVQQIASLRFVPVTRETKDPTTTAFECVNTKST